MEVPDKYDFLLLLDKKQQILILELFTHKVLRPSKLYKMCIYKSFQTLNNNLKELVVRHIIRKINHNESKTTYQLTEKGLTLAYLLASSEKRFNSYLNANNLIITIKIGKMIPDLFKKRIIYELEIDETEDDI